MQKARYKNHMNFDYSGENAKAAEEANALVQALIEEVEKVVVGKHNEIVMLITSMLAGGHVLIEDVPGVGKTTLAAALSKAAGLSFKRAQFTPDVMAVSYTHLDVYKRQALGRLQFETTTYYLTDVYSGHGITMKRDEKTVLNLHIPSGSPLRHEDVLDSYRRAYLSLIHI